MFDAFISYSHAADGKLAAAVQRGLHRFAKPLLKRRAIRVFRDESTLAMTPQLWPEIEKALRSSRFFSERSAPSTGPQSPRAHCTSRFGLLRRFVKGDPGS